MARKCTGKPNGRPKKPIDLAMARKLASMSLTIREIAVAIGVDYDTLVHREGFSEAYRQGLETFTGSIRKAQFAKAMRGDTPMLKFLGANYLGQSEKVRQELTGRDGGPVITANLSKLSDHQLSTLESILAAANPDARSGQD